VPSSVDGAQEIERLAKTRPQPRRGGAMTVSARLHRIFAVDVEVERSTGVETEADAEAALSTC